MTREQIRQEQEEEAERRFAEREARQRELEIQAARDKKRLLVGAIVAVLVVVGATAYLASRATPPIREEDAVATTRPPSWAPSRQSLRERSAEATSRVARTEPRVRPDTIPTPGTRTQTETRVGAVPAVDEVRQASVSSPPADSRELRGTNSKPPLFPSAPDSEIAPVIPDVREPLPTFEGHVAVGLKPYVDPTDGKSYSGTVTLDGKTITQDVESLVFAVGLGQRPSLLAENARIFGKRTWNDLKITVGDTIQVGTFEFETEELIIGTRPIVSAQVLIDGRADPRRARTPYRQPIATGRHTVLIEPPVNVEVLAGEVHYEDGETIPFTRPPGSRTLPVSLKLEKGRPCKVIFVVRS